MELGEEWAYRKRGIDPLEPVAFLRQGRGKRAKWALIRFLHEDRGGLEDWVPEGRLKVPWAQVDELRAKEARWAAVSDAFSPLSEAMDMAVGMTLDALLELYTMDCFMGSDTPGVSRIYDVA